MECYSSWEYTIMKLQQMNFVQLLNLALNTKKYDERVGELGIILRHHEFEFTNFLTDVYSGNIPADKAKKKLTKLIYSEIKQRSDFVRGMKTILNLCSFIYNL